MGDNGAATILYIEDNPDSRRLVQRVLQYEGYQVLEASDARQALEMLQQHLPALILMDINMPDIDGYTLTHQLKNIAELQNVPILALTANVMKGDRERSLEAGCDGYIQKPIDVDNLVDLVRRYISMDVKSSRAATS